MDSKECTDANRAQPSDPLEVSVDWGESTDVAIYRCGACGFETSIADNIVAHMKAHGAHRLTVTPQHHEDRFDRVRRG